MFLEAEHEIELVQLAVEEVPLRVAGHLGALLLGVLLASATRDDACGRTASQNAGISSARSQAIRR